MKCGVMLCLDRAKHEEMSWQEHEYEYDYDGGDNGGLMEGEKECSRTPAYRCYDDDDAGGLRRLSPALTGVIAPE